MKKYPSKEALIQTESGRSKRVFGLDAVRAAAILMVLAAHTWPTRKASNWALASGVLGVEMFFILSGFLIGGIVLRLVKTGQLRTFSDLFDFWRRRWYRTLPNYYLFLFMQMAWRDWVLGYRLVLLDNWQYLFFVQNLSGPPPYLFPETWSLSIEEWFYLIFPLLLWGAIRIIRNNKISSEIVILIILTGPFLLRIAKAISIVHLTPDIELHRSIWETSFRKTVVLRLDVVMYGVVAAFIKDYHPVLWRRLTHLWMLGILLVFAAALSVAEGWPLDLGNVWESLFFWPCAAIGFALLVARASLVTEPKRWIALPTEYVATISYALYLCHGLVVLVIKNVSDSNCFLCFPEQTWLWTLAVWTFSFLIASLVCFLFERPIMKLRDRSAMHIKLSSVKPRGAEN